MSAGELFILVMNIAGGLAFFMFGMKAMSEGLQAVAGGGLRELVHRLTQHRVSGALVGTLLGFAIHSGAATILLVTFIHAGMMTLAQSIPVVLGANVGTTLSMQLISFKIGKYALLAIAAGVVLRVASSKKNVREIGTMLFGFGLLFLGMDTMSAAIAPLKQSGQLNSLLAITRDTSVFGFVLGVVVSTTITAVFQSSGATIGILFALCQAGVFGELREVFPLIIGTHIGTCSATLLGALGTSIEARRSAYAHLAFNVIGTVFASLMLPFYLWVVPMISHDLTQRIANAHTLVQLVNAILFLPLVGPFAKLVVVLSPSKDPPQERSHLNEHDLETPELAIANAMREARRMAAVTRLMLVHAVGGLLRITSKPFGAVVKNEAVVDMMKDSINDFLAQIAARKLSTRQAILLQHLMVTVADLERIGDHIESITEITQQKVANRIWFDQQSMSLLVEQYQRVDRLLRLTILSLDPELRAFKRISDKMLELRREFIVANRELRARYRQLIIEHHETSLNGLYYDQYLRVFERVVRHTKSIARLEQTAFFNVKPHKFATKTGRASFPHSEVNKPLVFEESILREDLHFDDLGIDLNQPPAPDEITRA